MNNHWFADVTALLVKSEEEFKRIADRINEVGKK